MLLMRRLDFRIEEGLFELLDRERKVSREEKDRVAHALLQYCGVQLVGSRV